MLGIGCGPTPSPYAAAAQPPEPTQSPAMDAALPLPMLPSPCPRLWLRTCQQQPRKSTSGTDTRAADATAHHGAQPVHAAAHWKPCSPPPPLPPLTAHLQMAGWTPPPAADPAAEEQQPAAPRSRLIPQPEAACPLGMAAYAGDGAAGRTRGGHRK
ncbi:atherin-like [Manis pentadactyla]|uniref:atherin-like n=1 Tax=Manis pentadactyla TaxID=143292 RepID=UPI00255CAEF1|nr:atherin-like [Manis pentadactyla]